MSCDLLYISNPTVEQVDAENGTQLLFPFAGRGISGGATLTRLFKFFETPRCIASVVDAGVISPELARDMILNSLLVPNEEPPLYRGLLIDSGQKTEWRSLYNRKGAPVILGAPFFCDPHGEKNAALGCRDVIASLNPELINRLYIGDLLTFTDEGTEQFGQRAKFCIEQTLQAGAVPIVIGGDHSVSHPLIEAAFQSFGSLAVICFDAHADDGPAQATPSLPTPLSNANVMSHVAALIGEDSIEKIGVRTGVVGTENCEFEFCFRQASEAIEKYRDRPVYLSIDIDVLDPSYAPDVNYPAHEGLSPQELEHLLAEIIGQLNVVGADVVEICPTTNGPNRTAKLAAAIVSRLVHQLEQDA